MSKKTYTPRQSRDPNHYTVVLGESIGTIENETRWKLLDLLGEGTFSKVVEVWDRRHSKRVAIKITKSNHLNGAKAECSILADITKKDENDEHHLNRYISWFTSSVGEHMCIVMPKYHRSLLQHIERHGVLSTNQNLQIIGQIVDGVNYLHTTVGLIHTDLKPENIVFEHGRSIDIRIVDFGTGVYYDPDKPRTYQVCTRHYRPPEVILEEEWSFAVDIWSIGCIIAEMFTGAMLFPMRSREAHIAYIREILYVDISNKDNDGDDSDDRSGRSGRSSNEYGLTALEDMEDIQPVMGIVKRCLDCDAKTRITSTELLASVTKRLSDE